MVAKKRRYVRRHHSEFWYSRFFFLLISLIFLILVFPYFIETPLRVWTLGLIGTLVLIAGVYELRNRKLDFYVAIALAVISIAANTVYYISATKLNAVLDSTTSIVFLAFVSVSIFRYIIQGRTIKPSTIYGALCIYLLLGIVFGDVYTIIEDFVPGSFHASSLGVAAFVHITRFSLIPFSYATLTTVGHSKIIAVKPLAESAVIIEQVTGVFYLAVLIARLVTGFSIMHKEII